MNGAKSRCAFLRVSSSSDIIVASNHLPLLKSLALAVLAVEPHHIVAFLQQALFLAFEYPPDAL